MPAAIVITLQATEDGVLYGATGQHAHGYWLNSWRAIAGEVGDALHDERALRQFTVSPLMGTRSIRHGRTPVRAGDEVRLRLTTLDASSDAELLGRWVLERPDPTLGGVAWQVQRIARHPDDHDDAGESSYEQLAARSKIPSRWDVAFPTPTAFHLEGERYLPFPLPHLLVESWLERWQANAPPTLPPLAADSDAFLARVASGCFVSQYRLKTASFRFRFEKEVPQIGCTGTMTLDGRNLDETDRSIVATLGRFAYYCGSGHHTTMGMGQTRVASVRV